MITEDKVYSDRDVYNESGILLVAKNELLTKEVQTKLASIGNLQFKYPPDQQSLETPNKPKPEEDIKKSGASIQRRVNSDCGELLSKASDILNKVLFQSKNKPYWAAVYALENYVDWLYTHCLDVALLSTMIAIELDFPETQLAQFSLGSFLHDVGKLLIPKSIIQKPKKLTRDEYLLMEQHCILGSEMLHDGSVPQVCLNIILQHHERLDGRGYPYGLVGNQISYEAQIVMIADVLDAMTSYRPYKKEKSMGAAFSELKRKEDLFNLDLVKCFASVLISRRSCTHTRG